MTREQLKDAILLPIKLLAGMIILTAIAIVCSILAQPAVAAVAWLLH